MFEDPARALPAAAGGAASFGTRSSLVVLAMNTQRAPTAFSITLQRATAAGQNGEEQQLSNRTVALAMFEGGGTAWDYAHPAGDAGPTSYGPRTIPLVCDTAKTEECVLTDFIDTFGTRAYRIFFESKPGAPAPPPSTVPTSVNKSL